MPKQAATSRLRREEIIENAVLRHPDRIGFPDAQVIRRCRIAPSAGTVDLILLPKHGPTKLVLVEAKGSTAADAASKVIGQLLMYYAGALTLGARGLRLMREFAERKKALARGLIRTTPKALTDGLSPPAIAWEQLHRGPKLIPHQVKLFIALDGISHPALRPTISKLRECHHLNIGIIFVHNGHIRDVDPAVED